MTTRDPDNLYLDPEWWTGEGIKDAKTNTPTSDMYEPEVWIHAENQQAYVKAYRKESMRLLLNRNET